MITLCLNGCVYQPIILEGVYFYTRFPYVFCQRHPVEHVIPSGFSFVIIIKRFRGNNLVKYQPPMVVNSLFSICNQMFDNLIEREPKEYDIKSTFKVLRVHNR